MMKKIYLFLTVLFCAISVFGQYVGRNSTIGNSTASGFQSNKYLGDKFPKYNFFSNGGWDNPAKVQIGYGTSSIAMSWINADWEADSGSDRLVKKDEGFGNFSSLGNWYFVGRYSYDLSNYAYNDEVGWTNNTNLDIPGNATYYIVNPLNTPTTQSANTFSASQINLNWSKDAQNHNVMIVRSTNNSFTAPSQGTAYAVGNSLGTGTVIYNGNGTNFSDTGLNCNTTYYYAFYSENYSYYSTVVNANATTTASVPTINTQPSNASTCTTGTTNFAVAASGSGLSYQWQEFISSWNNLSNTGVYSGVATNSLTITNPTPVMNGYKYRCVVTGTCSATSTNTDGNATLTVYSPAAITAHPSTSSATYCTGDTITPLSVIETGSSVTYQWYSSDTPSNSGGTLISGATSATYTPSNASFSKKYYYVKVSNSCNSVTSNVSGLITVNPNSFFANLETASQSICVGNNITNGAITGRLWIDGLTNSAGQGSDVTVQFGYSSTNLNPNTWTDWVAATYKEDTGNDDRYTINGFGSLLPAGTYYYTFRYKVGSCNWVYGGFSTGNWNGTTNVNGVLTVNTNNAITTHPSTTSQNVCINTSATALSVVATGASLSYQWYSSDTPSNSGGTLISGATSASYTPSTSVAGTQYYYVVVSGSCGASVTSNISGAIIVNANSTATLSSAPGTNIQTVLNDSTPITPITYALSGISNATVSGLPTGVAGVYSSNTFTISGAPTQVGIYNYSITFTANCGTVNNLTGSITVNSHVVEFANIQYPKVQQTILLGDTFDVFAQVKITGITDSLGHGAGASGWLGYSTTKTNPNTWTNWTAINYNPLYETSGSYQISNDEYYYPDFVNAENLEGGTYYYASRFQRNGSSEYTYGGTDGTNNNFSGGIWGTNSSNGPLNVSGVVKIVDEVIWDGTQWKWYDDDDSTWKTIAEPNLKLKAKIEGNYPATAPSFTCKKLTIDNGVNVTIGTGKYIKVINEVVNNNTGNTNFTVESDANLIQVNDNATNTGKVIVKRNAMLKRLDYNYWGSPVSGQNLRLFSIATAVARFYVYREVDDYFDGVFAYSSYSGFSVGSAFPIQDRNTYNFEPAKGYAVRAPNDYTASLASFEGIFEGGANNGQKTFLLEYTDATHGNNLIANPYPSNIDFDALYTENQTKIYQTAYFWTNVNPNPIMQGANYPANYNGTDYYNNYAVYNGSGGVAATSTTSVNGSKTPNQFIKVGQGFLIKSKAAGKNQNLVFKNAIRTADNSGYYFNAKTTNVPDRYWLTLSTPLDVHNDILIAYKTNATNDFELDFDAPLLTSPPDSFYSVVDDKKLMIQGRKYPLLDHDKIILGQRFYQDGTYTISLKEKEGIFALNQNIYLKDKLLNTLTNLQESAYTFTATAGESADRFEIVYLYEDLGNDNASQKELIVYQSDGFIFVDSPIKLNKISIYDVTGKLLYQENTNAKNAKINAGKWITGEYFVTIITVDKSITKKIRIK